MVSSSATRILIDTGDRRLPGVSTCCARGDERAFGAQHRAARCPPLPAEEGFDRTAQRMVNEVAARGVDGSERAGDRRRGWRDRGRAAKARRLASHERRALARPTTRKAGKLVAEAGARGARSIAGMATSWRTRRSIVPADVVVMHRVVCCYPDAEALVGAAAGTGSAFSRSPSRAARGGHGWERELRMSSSG